MSYKVTFPSTSFDMGLPYYQLSLVLVQIDEAWQVFRSGGSEEELKG